MGKYASRDSTGTPVAWGDITGKPSTFDPNPHDNAAHSTAYAPLDSPTFTTDVENMGIEYWRGTTKILNKAADGWLDLFTRTTAGADAQMIISNVKEATITNNNYSGTSRALSIIGYNTSNLSADPLVSLISNWEKSYAAPVILQVRAYDDTDGFIVKGNGNVSMHGLHVGGTSDAGDNNLLVDGNATAGAFKTANFTILQSGTDLLINYGATNILKISSAGYLRVANEMEPHAAL